MRITKGSKANIYLIGVMMMTIVLLFFSARFKQPRRGTILIPWQMGKPRLRDISGSEEMLSYQIP